MIDCHKIGHIGDILPGQSLALILKTKHNKTKQHNNKKLQKTHKDDEY